jgi:hypothetical protein
MIYLTIVAVTCLLCMTIVVVAFRDFSNLECKEAELRRELEKQIDENKRSSAELADLRKEFEKQVDENNQFISALKEKVQVLESNRSKSLTHSDCVNIENAIGATLKTQSLIADLENDLDAYNLRVEQARKKSEESYYILQILRGHDRNHPVPPPADLGNGDRL